MDHVSSTPDRKGAKQTSQTSSRSYSAGNGLFVLIIALAAVWRVLAALQLPPDFDEPIYLEAGAGYAELIRAGDWRGVIDFPFNREHPPLVKLLYALPYWVAGPTLRFELALIAARLISALFGVLAVALLARHNLTAGLLLAGHSLVIKYTSQAYLEALPAFFTLWAVVAAYQASSGPSVQRPARPLVVSALLLGLGLAGKLTYAPLGLVWLHLWLVEGRARWRDVGLGLVAMAAAFWAFSPSLWLNPAGGLAAMGGFYLGYTQGADVAQAGYPWYQPVLWLAINWPARWHPQVFLNLGIESLTAVAALIGLVWRRPRWLMVWGIAGLGFLLVWPTKWPQYTLMLCPALSLLAEPVITRALAWLRDQNDYYGVTRTLLPRPSRAIWAVVALTGIVIFSGYVFNIVWPIVRGLNWTTLTAETTAMPTSATSQLSLLADDRVVVVTSGGLFLIRLGDSLADAEASVNQPPPGAEFLQAFLVDSDGQWWLGARNGLWRAETEGTAWQPVDGVSGPVFALAESGGSVWVAHALGVSRIGPERTQTERLPAPCGGPGAFSLAALADRVWVGGLRCVTAFDQGGAVLAVYGPEAGFAQASVAGLTIDQAGQVWAATRGDGVLVFSDGAWTRVGTGADGLDFTTFNAVSELTPGDFWISAKNPTAPGGAILRYDGTTVTAWTASNTGFVGGEPLSILRDPRGRIWIATRANGVSVYTPREINP